MLNTTRLIKPSLDLIIARTEVRSKIISQVSYFRIKIHDINLKDEIF